jgi:hypothetical protein
MDGFLGQAFGRQVFAEHAERQFAAQPLPPRAVVLRRIGIDRLVGPPVDREVGLGVSVEIVPAERQGRSDRYLEDPRDDRLSLPVDRARKADIHRDHSHG